MINPRTMALQGRRSKQRENDEDRTADKNGTMAFQGRRQTIIATALEGHRTDSGTRSCHRIDLRG